MSFTVTLLPSAAETQGSHNPNVTVPLVSTAPRSPSGSRFSTIASQGLPLDMAEQQPAGVGLQPDKPGIRWGGGLAAPGGLRITGEVKLIEHLTVQRHRYVGSVDRDLVVVPLADGVCHGREVRPLEPVYRTGTV